MPQLNGIEMIDRLRADPATRALPVVAVSASSLEHERRFYIAHGFQDFIGKPYPFQEIYRMLAQYAGARLQPVGEAAGATGSVAPVPASVVVIAPGSVAHRQLQALADAAARGELAGVRRCLAALPPEAIAAAARRGLDDAAQAYDFQALEAQVASLLAPLGAQPSQ
jgi:DNA-binding NarL/FixJ family response regulator